MTKNILHTIQRDLGGFSKGQKRIAAFILENFDRAAFLTASKLGQEVGVSESTVVRFAAELGYDGYPSMQQCPAGDDPQPPDLHPAHRARRMTSSWDQDVLDTVLQREMRAASVPWLEETDRSAFQRRGGARSSPRSTSTSWASAPPHFIAELPELLPPPDLRERHPGAEPTPPARSSSSCFRIGEGDVLVVMSASPATPSVTMNVVKLRPGPGRRHRWAMTDSEVSPLYQLADYTLLAAQRAWSPSWTPW